MKITSEKAIAVLKNWGWNEGEQEEIVAFLAQNDMIQDAEAEVLSDMISYRLTLTKKGIKTYQKWCQKHGYTPKLRSGNQLVIDDQDPSSVENTLEEWRG